MGFQILVNSAAHDAKTKCWKYVDDMTFAENRLASQIGSMQTDLEKFRQWSEENHLKLNPSKCQAIQVCFSKTPPNLIDLRIGTDSIPYVSEAKVLGLWLQSDLKWSVHIQKLLEKANKKMFLLRTLKRFGFGPSELSAVYTGYIRPVLEYADVIWHSGLTRIHSDEIESIQRRACKTILGHHSASYDDNLKVCNLETLEDRRLTHCIQFAQTLSNNSRTCSLLPPTRFEQHRRQLRKSQKLSQIRCRTTRFKKSPIPFFIDVLKHVKPNTLF